MKNIVSKQHGSPSNYPADGDMFMQMLETLTEEELTDALNEALESMTNENYDSALVDAYLAALDRKAPMPEVADADIAFANLKNRLVHTVPNGNGKTTTPRQKAQSVWRIGLIAALTVICLMGGMVVAQAAGVDVFGAMARWTDDIFSLGSIRSEGSDNSGGDSILGNRTNAVNDANRYETLQEALDAFGITEVCEPTRIPEEYSLNSVDALCLPDGTLWHLSAAYTNGTKFLHLDIESYQGEPKSQIEKTDTPVEVFSVEDITVYLFQNSINNVAAWATEHYEYTVSGPVEKSELKQIVLSAHANVQ